MSSSPRNRRPPTRKTERVKRGRRALVAMGVSAALVVGTGYGTWQYISTNEFLLNQRCEVPASTEEARALGADQAHMAALLALSAANRELPLAAASDAIAISSQETQLSTERFVEHSPEAQAPSEEEPDSSTEESAPGDEDDADSTDGAEIDADSDTSVATDVEPDTLSEPSQRELIDPDQLELFAQGRPGWGDGAQDSATNHTLAGFYDALMASWQDENQSGAHEGSDEDSTEDGDDDADEEPSSWSPELDLAEVALVLQRPHNAQFYPDHEALGDAWSSAFLSTEPDAAQGSGTEPAQLDANLSCQISAISGPEGAPEAAAAELGALANTLVEVTTSDGQDAEPDGEPQVRISILRTDGEFDVEALISQWAVAGAYTLGIETVRTSAAQWDRSSGTWQDIAEDEASAEDVIELEFR